MLQSAPPRIAKSAAWVLWLSLYTLEPLAYCAPQNHETTAEKSTPAEKKSSIVDKQQRARQQIAAAERVLEQARRHSPASGDVTPQVRQLELLKFLQVILAQQQATQDSLIELQRALDQQQHEHQLLLETGLSSPPPYSFLLLDQLQDEWAVELAHRDSVDAEIAATQDLLKLARREVDDRERARHAAKEALERNRDAEGSSSLSARLQLAEISSTVAHETVELHSLQLQEKKLTASSRASRRESLQQRINLVRESATFSKRDLDTLLEDLARTETDLKQRISEAQSALQQIDQQWLVARQRAEQSNDARDREAVTSWSVARQCRQKMISSLTQRLGQTTLSSFCWQCRYEVLNNTAALEVMRKWRTQAVDYGDRLNRARRLIQINMEACRADLAEVEDRLRNVRQDTPSLVPWLELRSDGLQQLANTYAATLLETDRMTRLLSRAREELEDATRATSAADWLATARSLAALTWRYEITSVDDEPITISDVIIAIGLCLLGFFASRRVSRGIGRRLLPRFGMAEGNAAALQSICFYLMLIVFAYFSLELIGIPLTVFAFLGGAVAIGVGFGSQNILNNFISGIILLFERPIRVGDLVDVDGLYGTIEQVGVRSTRVLTGSNLEIIVPNSRFLENNVTNMTLSDERFRASVAVGVAYGSPTRIVAELLEQAALQHSEVMQEPRPIILFKDFGNDALQFEVHFWIRMRTIMQGQRIESEVRHTIDELFGQANITIAFPQRDIHLDSSSPIEVRLQDPGGNDAAVKPYNRAA